MSRTGYKSDFVRFFRKFVDSKFVITCDDLIHNLEDIAGVECNTSLSTGDQIIVSRIVVKLCPNKYVTGWWSTEIQNQKMITTR